MARYALQVEFLGPEMGLVRLLFREMNLAGA